MKKLFFLVLFLHSIISLSQEICNNGIDDDGDDLIDLNDSDCNCGGLLEEMEGIITNPSFEDILCCPNTHSQMSCVSDWTQPSGATTDYYNHCDFEHLDELSPPIFPVPDGDGHVGFHSKESFEYEYNEYAATILTEPLVAGTEYTIKLYTAWGKGEDTFDFSIFGNPGDLDDFSWLGAACPIGFGDWELLVNQTVIYDITGVWQEITLTFTPTLDMNAIAIGGPCELPGDFTYSYYYIDDITVLSSEEDDVFAEITESGSWCNADLALTAETDAAGGSWQWYKDGIALVGETDDDIDVMDYGYGDYSAVYFLEDNCIRRNYSVEEGETINVDFEFTSNCVSVVIPFENTSIIPDEVLVEWQWDFGDGEESIDENPSHTFDTPGTYIVELIGTDEAGCSDTIEYEIIIYPAPNAEIEFIAGGFSSEDGSTGGCILNPVQFNDLSSILDPGLIVDWNWDFGDGSSSTEENPEYLYDVVGTYTVTLTVTSDFGCSTTTSIEITMNKGLAVDLLVNEPSCFGFSDGSITINVGDIVGEVLFEIKDDGGNIVNEDNSNTANTLSAGWYYYSVEDESDCATLDSVLLVHPNELNIDITVNDPLCYGDKTAWARVDSIYNTTGDYNGASYIWNPNPADVSGEGADSTYNMGAGNYTLTINDDNGCSRVFDFEIEQPDSLFFSEFGFDPAYCRLHEYQSGNGVVFGAAAGGVPDYDYLWTHLETGETKINTTWGGRNPGNYKLSVTDVNGCVLEKSVFVDSLNPIADFSITSDQLNIDLKGTAPVEVVFTNLSQNFANPNNPSADTTFFWNLDHMNEDWQVSHNFFETLDTTYSAKGQTYTVNVCLVALNKNGCTDTACKVITIYEPIVFTEINVFTPNGDGVNDVFSFDFRSASISEFSCVIVNRWGVTIFEMDNLNDAWDGTDKSGSLCKNGTYFYTYKAITDNGTNLNGQGTVQIVTNN